MDLTDDVLTEVAFWLSDAEVERWSWTCRRLRQVLTRSYVWRQRVACWRNPLDLMGSENPENPHQWCCERQRAHAAVLRTVTDRLSLYHMAEEVLRIGPRAGALLTVLAASPRLSQAFTATCLLLALRFDQFLSAAAPLAEATLLGLASADYAFPVLWNHRERVQRDTLALYATRAAGTRPPNGPVEQAMLVAWCLFKVLRLPAAVRTRPYTAEDALVLRVYAGETRGAPVVVAAIVASLCERIGVRALPTRACLMVETEGDTGFVLLDGGKVRRILRARITSDLQPRAAALFMAPMSGLQLVAWAAAVAWPPASTWPVSHMPISATATALVAATAAALASPRPPTPAAAHDAAVLCFRHPQLAPVVLKHIPVWKAVAQTGTLSPAAYFSQWHIEPSESSHTYLAGETVIHTPSQRLLAVVAAKTHSTTVVVRGESGFESIERTVVYYTCTDAAGQVEVVAETSLQPTTEQLPATPVLGRFFDRAIGSRFVPVASLQKYIAR